MPSWCCCWCCWPWPCPFCHCKKSHKNTNEKLSEKVKDFSALYSIRRRDRSTKRLASAANRRYLLPLLLHTYNIAVNSVLAAPHDIVTSRIYLSLRMCALCVYVCRKYNDLQSGLCVDSVSFWLGWGTPSRTKQCLMFSLCIWDNQLIWSKCLVTRMIRVPNWSSAWPIRSIKFTTESSAASKRTGNLEVISDKRFE